MTDNMMSGNWLSKNWLVHHIHDTALEIAVRQYAKGVLLDIGCGEKPYYMLTKNYVTEHIGLDHLGSDHDKSQVDIFATAYETGVVGNSINTVLSTAVLEHLERPQDAINEMYRILKPDGHAILSVPFFWHLHEEPRDFYRYTKYGLNHLFVTAGFEIVEIKPLSGFVVTFSQELVYFIGHLQRGLLRYPIAILQWLIQKIAFWLNRWDKSYGYTWAYMVVARKKGAGLE